MFKDLKRDVQFMEWMGPYLIDVLLDSFLIDSHPRPPEGDGVYLISEKPWKGKPEIGCVPLYVGGNTGKSKRFRTRIGDLIADMFGFFGDDTAHHSGGQTLHKYCMDKRVSPKNLYIGWLEKCKCVRCAENKVYDELQPLLNKKRPSRCREH